jgi:23S rRNA pseudouridine2605 synthase
MLRLNLFLASAGVASRRKCDQLIFSGKVMVNGITTEKPGTQIDEDNDDIRVDGKRIFIDERKVYLMLNKPAGYITTVKEPFGRPQVMSLISEVARTYPGLRLFPVGRLDKESRGLLLFTNDGDFAQRLLHPGKKVKKVYRVIIDRDLRTVNIKGMERGIELDEGKKARAKIISANPIDKGYSVELSVEEGRKRLVRRLFACLGYKVLDLERIAIGKLKLGDLAEGLCRQLSADEAQLALSDEQTDNCH